MFGRDPLQPVLADHEIEQALDNFVSAAALEGVQVEAATDDGLQRFPLIIHQNWVLHLHHCHSTINKRAAVFTLP